MYKFPTLTLKQWTYITHHNFRPEHHIGSGFITPFIRIVYRIREENPGIDFDSVFI